MPAAPGAVGDGAGAGVPVDFLEGERRAQQILGKALAALDVVRRDGFGVGMDVEAAVFPGEQIGHFALAEMLAGKEDLQESIAEEFGERREG